MTATKQHGGITRRELLEVGATGVAVLAGTAALGGLLLTPRTAKAAAPVWTTVPDQVFTVGVPVHLDLKSYVTDPDGDPLGITLDQPLPQGLTLVGGVISGTPTAELASTQYVATADDSVVAPGAPTNLRAM